MLVTDVGDNISNCDPNKLTNNNGALIITLPSQFNELFYLWRDLNKRCHIDLVMMKNENPALRKSWFFMIWNDQIIAGTYYQLCTSSKT